MTPHLTGTVRHATVGLATAIQQITSQTTAAFFSREPAGHVVQGLQPLVQLLLNPLHHTCYEPLLKKELFMTRPLNVVALSGGTWRPSRTLVLTQAVLAELATLLPIQATLIELGDIARPLGGALSRDELPAEVENQLLAIEQADLLIVAAPVYRGSYPGLLKHLFDLVDLNALINTPACSRPLVAANATRWSWIINYAPCSVSSRP